jgi:putative oxidoreductase
MHMSTGDAIAGLARPMLSSIFLYGGYKALRNPDPLAARSAWFFDAAAPALQSTPLPQRERDLVRLNAGVQVAAGAMLAAGVLPRLSAAVLAGGLIPTTLGGHAYWREEDPAARAAQQVQFAKNVSVLGGLLTFVARG